MRILLTTLVSLLLLTAVASCAGEPAAVSTTPPTEIPPTNTLMPVPTGTSIPTRTPQPLPTDTLEPTPEEEESLAAQRKYADPGDYLDSLMVGRLERYFIIHLPPQYEPGEAMPVVFNLHGRGSNAIQQRDASQMNQKADEEGFIVVYPQALGQPTTWFGVLFGPEGQPDMDFFADLISFLETYISIDPGRVYATGISNGATMVNRLGCEMSDVFAAIAPVAGAHSGLHLCDVEAPVSVMAIHGTEDQIIRYEGAGSDFPSVHTWVEAWAERDGCQDTPESDRPYDDVLLETWTDCDDNTSVALYTVEGGGHTWLGLEYDLTSPSYIPIVGATDVIWDFFQVHPKNN